MMKPGDCLLLHGSTIHRGGENSSTKLRRTLGASWTQGHMRQEENQFLNIPKEVAEKLDEKTQRLIGYKMNPPFGYVGKAFPLVWFWTDLLTTVDGMNYVIRLRF